MKKAPAWLVEQIAAHSASGPRLWVGGALAFPEALRVSTLGAGEAPRGTHQAVFVARAEGPLDAELWRLRPACAPGAHVMLLFPEPGGGIGRALRGLVDPLGRQGRGPRSVAEQCGALLALGALGIQVVPLSGKRRGVCARLPEVPSPLDAEFAPLA